MTRRKVKVVDMMEIERSYPKTPFLGWNPRQVRKTETTATSPRLLSYRSCIASEMTGKEFESLKQVQEFFIDAAKRCKVSAEGKPTIPKE